MKRKFFQVGSLGLLLWTVCSCSLLVGDFSSSGLGEEPGEGLQAEGRGEESDGTVEHTMDDDASDELEAEFEHQAEENAPCSLRKSLFPAECSNCQLLLSESCDKTSQCLRDNSDNTYVWFFGDAGKGGTDLFVFDDFSWSGNPKIFSVKFCARGLQTFSGLSVFLSKLTGDVQTKVVSLSFESDMESVCIKVDSDPVTQQPWTVGSLPNMQIAMTLQIPSNIDCSSPLCVIQVAELWVEVVYSCN